MFFSPLRLWYHVIVRLGGSCIRWILDRFRPRLPQWLSHTTAVFSSQAIVMEWFVFLICEASIHFRCVSKNRVFVFLRLPSLSCHELHVLLMLGFDCGGQECHKQRSISGAVLSRFQFYFDTISRGPTPAVEYKDVWDVHARGVLHACLSFMSFLFLFLHFLFFFYFLFCVELFRHPCGFVSCYCRETTHCSGAFMDLQRNIAECHFRMTLRFHMTTSIWWQALQTAVCHYMTSHVNITGPERVRDGVKVTTCRLCWQCHPHTRCQQLMGEYRLLIGTHGFRELLLDPWITKFEFGTWHIQMINISNDSRGQITTWLPDSANTIKKT